MTTDRPPARKQPTRVGGGFKATLIAFSLMSMVVAWDLVARRDAAKAAAQPTATPSPSPSATPTP